MVLAAPAILDTLGSFLNFTGLMLMSSGAYHMMRMLCMVFVVLLSINVLRRQYTVAQFVGIGLVIFGLLFVSIMDLHKNFIIGSKSDKHDMYVGMLALLGGQFFGATHAVL